MNSETIDTVEKLNAMIAKKNMKFDQEELESRAKLILAEEKRQRAIMIEIETNKAHRDALQAAINEDHGRLNAQYRGAEDGSLGSDEAPDECQDTIGLMIAALQNTWGYFNGVHNDRDSANAHIERALTAAGMPFQPEDAA